jgi:ribosomal protein S12 methylthiotransferase
LTEWVVLPTHEDTHAYLEDDVPADVKQDRANEIMELQSQISWDLNQLKLGKHSNVLSIERRHFVGRTEFDSPDVDNEVLIDASKHYLKTGDFAMIKSLKKLNLIIRRTCLDFFSIINYTI